MFISNGAIKLISIGSQRYHIGITPISHPFHIDITFAPQRYLISMIYQNMSMSLQYHIGLTTAHIDVSVLCVFLGVSSCVLLGKIAVCFLGKSLCVCFLGKSF